MSKPRTKTRHNTISESKETPTETTVSMHRLRSKLLSWYQHNARDLPWRRTRDPYSIWVAEIMLQQTRVETVIPYYEKFLHRFPSVYTLAKSPLDDVLAAWSGLGYYRRARLLHAGARYVCDIHQGIVPTDVTHLRSIPGIGAYTTGAIGSQAFDLEVPLVDGNVARVFSRIFAIQTDVKKGEGVAKVWKLAEEIVQGPEPGKLNNALMELGATICIPREPRCLLCPVREECQARKLGLERILPVTTPKQERPRVYQVAAILHKKEDLPSKVVFAQCSLQNSKGQEGLFAGMWEPPRILLDNKRQLSSKILSKRFSELLGIPVHLDSKPINKIEHILSHRTLDIQVYTGIVDSLPKEPPKSTRCQYERFELIEFSQLSTRGIATLTRKILEQVHSLS